MNRKSLLKNAGLTAAAALLVAGAAHAVANTPNPCFVPTSGPVPPPGCEYLSPADVHSQGLADVLALEAEHSNFLDPVITDGGTLGGQVESFSSVLELHFTGINELEGFSTTVILPAAVETHTGPRKTGDAVQKFETDMYKLEGVIRNHKDFEYIHIVAGTANGLPSPGVTTMTKQSDGRYFFDSLFNVNFKIEYKGAKGSKLEGIEGVAEGTVTMKAYDDPKLEDAK
jgi:hypothetical protein